MLTFDDLLESFGFKTFEFGGSQLKKKKNRPFTPCLFSVFSCLVSFTFFFLGDPPDLFDLMALTLKYQVGKRILQKNS